MATEVHVEEGWHEHVTAAGREALERIASAILVDAKAACPIDTGVLVASLDKEIVDDTTARVGSKDVKYSTYVEEGHRIFAEIAPEVWGDTGKVQPPQPYLRPALYRERSL